MINLKSVSKKGAPLIPAYVLLLLWLIFSIITIGWIFAASFSTTREVFTNTLLKSGFHIENYWRALVNQNVARYFLNSFIYTGASSIGIMAISAPAAYVLGRMEFRGRKILMNSFLVTMSVPTVMIIIPLFTIMVNLKLIGSMFTLIVLYIVSNVPFTVYFLTGFFSTLPTELEDSALVDGCSPYKAFWRIILPLAQPGIITVGIFNFMTVWNEYFMALVFANKTELRTLAVGLQAIVQSMRYSGDWSGLFAAVVIVFLPTFILYILLSQKIIVGITGGAIKG
jgi:N-acetylglucosamine transport system permease protein